MTVKPGRPEPLPTSKPVARKERFPEAVRCPRCQTLNTVITGITGSQYEIGCWDCYFIWPHATDRSFVDLHTDNASLDATGVRQEDPPLAE